MAAMKAAMMAVYDYQIGNRRLVAPAEIKAHDATLLTQCDKDSDVAAKAHLLTLPTEYDIQPEDGDGRTTPGAEYLVWLDNLDGTRPFTNGLITSTVILAVYDYAVRQLVWCAIGEPISGRIWISSLPGQETKGAWLVGMSHQNQTLSVPRPIQVNADPLDGQATVLMDLAKGFPRKGKDNSVRQILTNNQVHNLINAVTAQGPYVLVYQSNGCQQAAVANGGEKMVASITTAMGGEWDAAGVLLVLEAGGAARAFRRNDDHTLTEADPLDPFSYDLLVCANSKTAADQLAATLIEVCKIV